MTTTNTSQPTAISQEDTDILRRLAERKAAIAADPANTEKRAAWYALDAGHGDRVMLLAEDGAIRDANKPVSDQRLQCSDPWARAIEKHLLWSICHFEDIRDDYVVEPTFIVGCNVQKSDFGVDIVMHQGGDDTHMGSRRWDPPNHGPGRLLPYRNHHEGRPHA
jgi:hypothetical protein